MTLASQVTDFFLHHQAHQRQLWVRAKPSRTRHFHALYERIYRSDVLWEAWRRVRGNRGYNFVLDADIQGYFDNIRRDTLLEILKDRIWAARCSQLGVLVRYADDFVAMCRTKSRTREALRRIGLVMDQLGRTGNADREFNKMDGYVFRRIRRRQLRRGGQRPTKRKPWTGQQLYGMGLYKLQDTVRYPAQATPRRSSLTRVPENGTHGLKGRHGNGPALSVATAP